MLLPAYTCGFESLQNVGIWPENFLHRFSNNWLKDAHLIVSPALLGEVIKLKAGESSCEHRYDIVFSKIFSKKAESKFVVSKG